MPNDELKSATLADLLRRQPRTEEVRVGVDGEGYRLVVRGLTRPDFEALLLTHQPSETSKARYPGRTLTWDPETFPVALVAACLVEPDLTADEVAEVFAAWTKADVDSLFLACYDLCTESVVSTWGKGSAPTAPSA